MHPPRDFSWSRFFAELGPSWGPRAWKRPCPRPLLTKEEAIAILAAACEPASADQREALGFRIRLFRDGVASDLDPERIPLASDVSPERYVERLAAVAPGESTGLILNDYQCLAAEPWTRARDFFRAWFDQVGMLAGGATADIFFANYAETPFGVHKDNQDIFTWVVSGRKRFFIWPAEAFDEFDGDDIDFREHRDDAIVLDGEAGDLMYWDSSYWHIAESVGDPAVTLSLGRLVGSDEEIAIEDTKRALEDSRMLDGLESASALLHVEREGVQTHPEPLRNAATHIGERLVDSVRRRWLARRSNVGLQPPPRRSTPLCSSIRVMADPAHPILWAETEGGFLVAGAGRTTEVLDAPWIPVLLDALNRGEPATSDEFLDRLPEDTRPPGWRARAMETIAMLHSSRALVTSA